MLATIFLKETYRLRRHILAFFPKRTHFKYIERHDLSFSQKIIPWGKFHDPILSDLQTLDVLSPLDEFVQVHRFPACSVLFTLITQRMLKAEIIHFGKMFLVF